MKVAEYAKMYVALVGLIVTGLLALNPMDIPGSWHTPLLIIDVIAAAFAVWRVPNADPPLPTIATGKGPAFDEWDEMQPPF